MTEQEPAKTEKKEEEKKPAEEVEPTGDEVPAAATDAEEPIEEQRLVNIKIVDLNKREIKLKMVQYELILELREFLAEHVYTCFFTNYYLEHDGKVLSDYSDLSELDLETEPRIYMRPKLYDERSARQHVKKVSDILTTPSVLNAQQITPEEEQMSEIAEKGKTDGLSLEEIEKQ